MSFLENWESHPLSPDNNSHSAGNIDQVLFDEGYGPLTGSVGAKPNSPGMDLSAHLTPEEKAERIFATINRCFDGADTNHDHKLQNDEMQQFAARRDITYHQRKAFEFLSEYMYLPRDISPSGQVVNSEFAILVDEVQGYAYDRPDLDTMLKGLNPKSKVDPMAKRFSWVETTSQAVDAIGLGVAGAFLTGGPWGAAAGVGAGMLLGHAFTQGSRWLAQQRSQGYYERLRKWSEQKHLIENLEHLDW